LQCERATYITQHPFVGEELWLNVPISVGCKIVKYLGGDDSSLDRAVRVQEEPCMLIVAEELIITLSQGTRGSREGKQPCDEQHEGKHQCGVSKGTRQLHDGFL